MLCTTPFSAQGRPMPSAGPSAVSAASVCTSAMAWATKAGFSTRSCGW